MKDESENMDNPAKRTEKFNKVIADNYDVFHKHVQQFGFGMLVLPTLAQSFIIDTDLSQSQK